LVRDSRKSGLAEKYGGEDLGEEDKGERGLWSVSALTISRTLLEPPKKA